MGRLTGSQYPCARAQARAVFKWISKTGVIVPPSSR